MILRLLADMGPFGGAKAHSSGNHFSAVPQITGTGSVALRSFPAIWILSLTLVTRMDGDTRVFIFFISPLFNQVGQLRTSSHLQLRPGQGKAKQCDKNNTELHMNKHTVNNTIETYVYSGCK